MRVTNKLREKLIEKSLIRKQGDVLYDVLYGQLGSNFIVAAKNCNSSDYKAVHKNTVCCISSIYSPISMHQEPFRI